MEAGILTTIILPISLFFIMFGMGISLTVSDFGRVLDQPKAFVVGITAQMLLLPLLAFIVISAFEMDPLLAVGLMILSFCPGGTTSNMFSYLAKGDIALSISLTAAVSLIAPFTIPFFANIAMNHILGEGSSFSLPLIETAVKLLIITVVPVALGMALRSKKEALCDQMETPVKIFSMVFLFVIIAGIANNNSENLVKYLQQIGVATLVLNLAAMATGLLLATGFKLNKAQSITISYEVGIQNGTTAMLITGTILGNSTMTIAPAIYGLLMFGTGGVMGVLLNRFFVDKTAEASDAT